MPNRKDYKDLSRSQQYRRRQSITKACIEHCQGLVLQEDEDVETRVILCNNVDIDYNVDMDDIEQLPTNPNPACNELDSESNSNVEEDECNIEWPKFHLYKEKSLAQFLRYWAIENNITHTALTKLLKGLRMNVSEDLPCDSRTLLQTPKISLVHYCNSGSYYHYGLRKGLTDHLRNAVPSSSPIDNPIKINLNIDGLPLRKSSKSQIWPLLAQVVYNDKRGKPFFIGAFHGYCKPSTSNEILDEFIKEYLEIKTEGFEYLNRKYSISINSVICDSPARSFVKGVKSHTGYNGCEKCEDEGEWRDNRMVFLIEHALLRTDEAFLLRKVEDHHISVSPFEAAGLKMISQFPLDYMHLVCLEVTKRLIKFWLKGVKSVKLSSSQIHSLSTDLKLMKPYISSEFNRKPRGLDELDRWKATELRTFLLYTGFLAMASYLSDDYLRHFYCLQCAITILCNPFDYSVNGDYAHQLLLHFVKAFKILYGEEYVAYNIHNLVHLFEDTKLHGCLDMFSAFPFENFMQEIKKIIRKTSQPLQQLQRRLSEMSEYYENPKCELVESFVLQKPMEEDLPFGYTHSHQEIQFKDFTISCSKQADKFCYIKDGQILCIEKIAYADKEEVVLAKVLKNSSSVHLYPCDSRNLGINVGNEWSNIEVFPVDKIVEKILRLPYKNTYCFLPLLHTAN
ncbi:uncharacterized protein [Prorops nasuta]|uniref:uncharacterized protein isoform X1 n=1 Tax=Prorops nasuta TaxID=863751 RepID=UPI0034CE9864